MTDHATTYKELRRSKSDRMIAGVSGGLGQYFDVNPVLYRVGFVVLTFFGGAGLLIYAACALVIPSEGAKESIASDVLRNHRQRPFALIGLGLAAIAGIALLSHLTFNFHGDVFWVAVLLVGALLIWSQARGEAAPGEKTRRRRWPWIVLAALGALIVAAAIAAAVVATTFARLAHGVGDKQFAPLTASALRHDYQVGVGSLRLDLSRVDLPPGTTPIHVEAGIGHVRIIVPRDVSVRAKTHVTWGDAELLGHDESGHNVRADVGPEDAELQLDTRVGIGQVEVDRAVR
jgi:phage shock protein PspC (stress-responsive transcriptional regulator)/predicted membrane protein